MHVYGQHHVISERGLNGDRYNSCTMRAPPSPCSMVASERCSECGSILRHRARADSKRSRLEVSPLTETVPDQHATSSSPDQESDLSQSTTNSTTSSVPAVARLPQPRRPKTSPSVLRMRAERLAVRRAMVCQIPGINRVRAERIIAEYPTIRALLKVSLTKLERLKIKEAPLGRELAVALKRVFE